MANSYLNNLYDEKRQYENLRPALVTCKYNLTQAKDSITVVVNRMIDCLFIDGNGYRQSDIEKQKKNIEARISDVETIIKKLDNNYNTVCSKINEEERRIRNANNSKNNSGGNKNNSNKGGSSKSSGGSTNNNSSKPPKPVKTGTK